jgi:hypothetical protein
MSDVDRAYSLSANRRFIRIHSDAYPHTLVAAKALFCWRQLSKNVATLVKQTESRCAIGGDLEN